jgi:hypothetical protein
MSRNREIIVEFVPCGAYVKVSAIDAATGTEVSIVGDPARGEAALEALAMRKLDYVMARRKGRRDGERGTDGAVGDAPAGRRRDGLYV